MGRISKRLAGPALVTNSAATKYTTPGATRTIVRHIHVSNPSGGSDATFTLSIGSDAAGTRVIAAETITTGTSRDYGVRTRSRPPRSSRRSPARTTC